jgi:hypothetical protein
MDFTFLEFYIKKKYNQKVEEYFNIGKQSVSDWRTSDNIPEKRILQFHLKEGSIDIKELFEKIYRYDKPIDFTFLEFYIKKKYNQKVEEYFNVNRISVSHWRTSGDIPQRRISQFQLKEESLDIKELFSKNLL